MSGGRQGWLSIDWFIGGDWDGGEWGEDFDLYCWSVRDAMVVRAFNDGLSSFLKIDLFSLPVC